MRPRRSPEATPEEIRELQRYLTGAGFWEGGLTGVMDDALVAALTEYQRSRTLAVSGLYDEQTRMTIDDELRRLTAPAADAGLHGVIVQTVRELYGPAMAAYLNHPEIGPILAQAGREQWDEHRLWGALEQTAWYRTLGESARQWEQLVLTDPGTADQRRRQRAGEVRDLVQRTRAGAQSIDAATFNRIVDDSLRYGWDEGQLNDMIVSLTRFDPNNAEPGGDMGTQMARVKQLAAQFLIRLGDEEAFNYARRIALGELAEDGMVATFRNQAKSRFATTELAALIDQGVTPADFFAEHRRVLAQELEMGVEEIDLTNHAKWGQILQVTDDQGKVRPMTTGETARWARSLDEWGTTEAAEAKTHAVFQALAVGLGKRR